MDPRKLEGILWLADLQADFSIADYKKYSSQNRVALTLSRKHREGICSSCRSNCQKTHSTDLVTLRDLSAFAYQVELCLERFAVMPASAPLCRIIGFREKAKISPGALNATFPACAKR